jgi:hypothetical protein
VEELPGKQKDLLEWLTEAEDWEGFPSSTLVEMVKLHLAADSTGLRNLEAVQPYSLAFGC